MKGILDSLVRAWHRVPAHWRKKSLVWLVTLAVSLVVIAIRGPGVLLVGLLLISFAGAVLKSYGVRDARHAEALLGNVWGYFRGAILVALLPVLWPALQALWARDLVSGLVQLLVLGLIAAVVFEQFSRLPKTWTAMSRQRARPRVYGGSSGRRRHR